MHFIDEVTILVQAGKGGDGCCSFRREKFVPWGGPDGGDGGFGGNVYLKSTNKINTLIDLNYQKKHQAESGKPGSGNLCSGKSGEDLIIYVPVGTVVFVQETNEVIGDLTENNEVLLVARGGKGGLGNHHFKSSTNRAPRKIIKGQLGEERLLRLELRLLADVGLLGTPNTGKSTLLSRVSAAKPKIADYPFTTMRPYLGIVKVSDTSFVMADLPGIIQGASSGVGLGIRFLKHLFRTKLLLHMVDLSLAVQEESQKNDRFSNTTVIAKNLFKQILMIEYELKNYSNNFNYSDDKLSNISRWIVVNKIDLVSDDQLDFIKIEFNNLIKENNKKRNNNANALKIFWIAAISSSGIVELCNNIAMYLIREKNNNNH